MVDFLKLVRNENMKIYQRPRAWIMMGILVGAVLLISILWRVFGGGDASMWTVSLTENFILFMLLTIFVVVVAAGSVAEEFTSGTIKLLLIRPWSRSKILLSKYISMLLFALMLAVALFISTLLTNWICFELLSTSDNAAESLFGNEEPNPFFSMLKFYGLKLLSLLVTTTMAFMISSIFRSVGLAIGLSLFVLLGLNNFGQLLVFLDKKWVDYLLFMQLDLTKYMESTTLADGTSIWFSLGVLGVYYAIFVAVTWYVFTKRDVSS